MKKLFIPFVMMCLGIVPVKATITDVSTIDNVVYLNPVTASAGSQCVLSIQMKNTVAIAGYEFLLTVPEGITFSRDEENFLLTSLSEARTTSKRTNFFDSTVDENGLLHVLCSTSAGTNPEDPSLRELYSFSGNDGEVCTVTIDIPSDFEAGTYPIVLTNIVLSNSAGDKGYETERVETAITIEENDGRIHFDENSTSLPAYTAGEKGDITMVRSIKANQWSTICLPFTLTATKAKEIFGDDMELAEFNGFSVDYGDDEENIIPLTITINLVPCSLSVRKPMTGGKPFLIKTKKDIEGFEADDVTLTKVVSNAEKMDSEGVTPGKLTGSLVKTIVPTDGLFISDNKFWYSTGLTNIKAFRCWFELGAVLDKETDFGARVFFHFDDEATGINDVDSSKLAVDDRYYNLNGQRVENPKKGLYIKNNKKIVVK